METKEDSLSVEGNVKWNDLDGFIKLYSVAETNNDYSHEIFDHLSLSKINRTNSYKPGGAKIFTKENAKKALLSYLFHKKSGVKTEISVLGELLGGWITSKTLFVLGIPTSGQSGILKDKFSEEQAKELIDSFVETVYKW